MAFGGQRVIGEESGFISQRPSGPARVSALKSAIGVESRQVPEGVRQARIQIAERFESFRFGGIPGLFQVPPELRQAAEGLGAPASGESPGFYLLPQPRPLAPPPGTPMTTIL